MLEHLSPESLNALDPDEQSSLRALSRSPHPYFHQKTDLPHLSDRFTLRNDETKSNKLEDDDYGHSHTTWPPALKDSPQTSDSGSEADDEHFWKGLPAPRATLHKGLRGRNEPLSGSSTPLPSPDSCDGGAFRTVEKAFPTNQPSQPRRLLDSLRARRVVRRVTEAGIVLSLGVMVASNSQVSRVLVIWGRGMHRDALSYRP